MTESRWQAATGGGTGEAYAERFRRRAASGCEMHGEAAFCMQLAPPGANILDAGCGTGRVALRLQESGYRCVGIDSDASMLDVARAASADVEWVLIDLADERAMAGRTDFDLVIAAGNVIPLVAPGSEARVIANLAAAVKPGGLLVAGFGLDAAHLPLPEAPFELADYDAWCAAAGLELLARHPAWDQPAGVPVVGYAVSVHRR